MPNTNGTQYSELCWRMLDRTKDFDYVDLTENEAYTILSKYLKSAISDFEVCRQDLTDRDDFLGGFNIVLSDIEKEILTVAMLIRYFDSNYLMNSTLLKPKMTSNDFKNSSQGVHAAQMLKIRTALQAENRRRMNRYSYRKSTPLFGGDTK